MANKIGRFYCLSVIGFSHLLVVLNAELCVCVMLDRHGS